MPRYKNHRWFCTHNVQCAFSGDLQGRLTNLMYVLICGHWITVFTCRQTKIFVHACTHTLSLYLPYTHSLLHTQTHTHTHTHKRREKEKQNEQKADNSGGGGGNKWCTDHSWQDRWCAPGHWAPISCMQEAAAGRSSPLRWQWLKDHTPHNMWLPRSFTFVQLPQLQTACAHDGHCLYMHVCTTAALIYVRSNDGARTHDTHA